MNSSKIRLIKSNNLKYTLLVILVWSFVIGSSFVWNSQFQKQKSLDLATKVAKANFDKDQAYRQWATTHGGVYVEPTQKTPPSPWMAHIPDRDLVTTDGRKLTLMNPAYMLREMMDDFSSLYGIRGRIVGIVYLNKNNEADAWEAKAIRSFEKGTKEILEVSINEDGEEYLRYMQPMIMNEGCQKCHGHLGFKNGEVRGGVSVSVPLKPYYDIDAKIIKYLFLSHFLVWIIGFLTILFISRRLKRLAIKEYEEQKDVRLSSELFNNSMDATCITDRDGKILKVNKSYCEITGYSEDYIKGKKPNIIKSSHHDKAFYEDLWDSLIEKGFWSGEIWNRKKSGEIFVVWENIVSVKNENGEIENFISTFTDITEKKANEKRISHLAHFDVLTDLPNRVLFQDKIEHAIALSARAGKQVALMFLDLDGFKKINDTLGHQTGDLLLVEVANRIKEAVRESDTISRLGGDEFTVILEEIDNKNDIKKVAIKILENIALPFRIQDRELSLTASIGISIFPTDGRDSHNIIKNADMAMYKTKDSGKNNYNFYNENMSLDNEEKFEIEHALRASLSKNFDGFYINYQPKFNLNKKIIGCEALVRWKHETLGFISPDRFISIAEDIGVVSEIDNFVLEKAAEFIHNLNQDGFEISLAVNISGIRLEQKSKTYELIEKIKNISLKHELLELEITESSFVSFYKVQSNFLQQLKDLNIKLAIDDFGTGYSSLSYIRHIPADTLKIDKSFIDGIEVHENDKTLVATIVKMAQDLGLIVVAEGVETYKEFSFLQSINCDLIQGYYLSKPLSPEDFSDLVKKNLINSTKITN